MDSEPPPPWIALPDLSPDDPANQGAGEAYIVLEFLPYWGGLSVTRKAAYLDRWNASPQWRAAIAERYGGDLHIEADAKDAAAWAKTYSKARRRPWRPFGR